MKTLLFACACAGHGTTRLAKGLTDIGLEGGHEIVGQGTYGSLGDVPNALEGAFTNPGTYLFGSSIGGYVGDNILAEAYRKWAPVRWSYNPPWDIREGSVSCMDSFESAFAFSIKRYLAGTGYFVDINTHLADWWPMLIHLGIPNRRVHITKDPREWIQKVLSYGYFSEHCNNYGSPSTYDTIYPYDVYKDRGLSRFEKVCHYWNDIHNWFSKCPRTWRFKVEDFNERAVQLLILDKLYPEATEDQVASFSLHTDGVDKNGYKVHPNWESMEHTGYPPYSKWSTKDKDTLYKICGFLMREFRYTKELVLV
jgi:hypothetical protein